MANNAKRIFERMEWIDRGAIPVQKALAKIFSAAPLVRDALAGKWLGHPVHTAVNDITIGAWTSAIVLDLRGVVFGGRKVRAGADSAVGLGLVAAVPAVLSGLVDFSKTDGLARRIGFVHATVNIAVAGLFGASFVARKAGLRPVGVVLSATGYGLMLGSGWLGGVMVSELGVGVHAGASSGASASVGESTQEAPAAPKKNGPQKANQAHQGSRREHHP